MKSRFLAFIELPPIETDSGSEALLLALQLELAKENVQLWATPLISRNRITLIATQSRDEEEVPWKTRLRAFLKKIAQDQKTAVLLAFLPMDFESLS